MRILVVEDSPTQAEALRALLADAGHDVTVASNGEAGWAQFNGGEFSLVITDVMMPNIDGYELCRRIKATARRDTSVVLLTSLAEPMEIIRGLECGADQFLTKPYAPEQLLKRLDTIFANRVARSSGGSGPGVRILFMGREFSITSEREQILDLLISTFEDAVRQNRELRRQEEDLEAANQELEAFTYSITHDLRNPLGQVAGFAELLLDRYGQELDPAARRYADNIAQAAQHMKRMVDELLQLGRVGRRDVVLRSTDLRPLVEAARAELEGQTKGRRVNWQIGPLPRVDCDVDLMESVFGNLLSNAVKFTRGRDPAVIEIGELPSDHETVILVRDNGAGFDMQHASRLFTVFERLHPSDEFEGTGVGLATVQRVIQKHGGRVWAEAEPGKGATFYFALPRPISGADR